MSKDLIVSQTQIENLIYTVRGVQVMLDSDLAEMYQVETRRLNEQVKRNQERFPSDFMFQLTEFEWEPLRLQLTTSRLRSQNATLKDTNLISQNATSSLHGGRRKLPFVFTEQGVAGLSGVLKSETAAQVHVAIMRAFVAMRKIIQDNQLVYSRLDKIEQKQLETDIKFERVFKALEGNTIPTQGVFFENQVFDAYEFTSKIIRSAKQNIVLIDNYIDENTLTLLAKKKKGVKVLLLTKNTGRQLSLDIQKANAQYGDFDVKQFTQSHDRFLIIDDGKEVYHIGASLKDLGKKWFAFSKMNKDSIAIFNAISGLI